MVQRTQVSIFVQIILCFIPLIWLYGFYRIEKLKAGILLVIAVAILALVIQMLIPFYYGVSWIVSVLIPIYYMIKWSQEWNEKISNEEDNAKESGYRLD